MEKLSPHQNIVVRRYKKGKHEEHGGAWKVAMADFALAMMALFWGVPFALMNEKIPPP